MADKRRRLTIGLMAVLFFGMLAFATAPEDAFAESVEADSWQDLKEKLNTLDNVTIVLGQDCTAPENDECLTLGKGKTITLDLDGHTLDRNVESSTTQQNEDLMIVSGNLTIVDSKGTGKITGGGGFDGAFRVEGGSLTMEGGTITGNCAWSTAGGVYVEEGSFTMNGGSIEDNYGEGTGGVEIFKGTFELAGGKIINNRSYFFCGGVYINKGSFTMTGGEISGNRCDQSCSVVRSADWNEDGAFDLRGGSIAGVKYIDNHGWDLTGTIEIDGGMFNLSGEPSITSDGSADVYLAEDKLITVTGKLDDSLKLSVLTAKDPGEGAPVLLTDGLKNKGKSSNFKSMKEEYAVGETAAGEAVLGVPSLWINYMAGRGTGSDVTEMGIKDCIYTLRDCMFTPPEGMRFTGWIFWSNPNVHEAGTTFTLNGNKKLTAQYECIEHNWVTEYKWAEDNSSVTATRTCQVGGEKETETVAASLSVKDPTCEEKGLKTWTSDAFTNKAFSVQTKKEDIDALGHDWGDWTTTKEANALTEGLQERVCSNDPSHVEEQVIPATGVRGTLLNRVTAKGKKLKISWTKVDGAEGYDIFFARCKEGGCKYIKTINGNQTFAWTKTGLKKKTAYKVYVKAFAAKDGVKTYIRTSPTAHAFTTGYDKKYTNAKAVTVKKTAVSIKTGSTYQIKAKVKKLKRKKKLMAKGHAPKLRYLSSDQTVAAVSSSGKITAKAKGTCTIYVYAHNGISKSITVTVK